MKHSSLLTLYPHLCSDFVASAAVSWHCSRDSSCRMHLFSVCVWLLEQSCSYAPALATRISSTEQHWPQSSLLQNRMLHLTVSHVHFLHSDLHAGLELPMVWWPCLLSAQEEFHVLVFKIKLIHLFLTAHYQMNT